MALRLLLMFGLIAVFVFCAAMVVVRFFVNRSKLRDIVNRAVSAADIRQQEIWSSTKHVQSLIGLHARMVFKHGPDSEEARAFRFGVESIQLFEDEPALAAFNQIADLIEENARLLKNRK